MINEHEQAPINEVAVTVIVPAFNEENAINETIAQIQHALEPLSEPYELIVVDDGSTDDTPNKLALLSEKIPTLRVLRHSRNRGYGAALKTGIRAGKSPIVVITDADGTYPNQRIPELVREIEKCDMAVGARVGKQARIPLVRRPAKWLIGKLSNYLAGYRIPDINSGLRAMKRRILLDYIHILPDGFSLTTTITLAMLTRGYDVNYLPIEYAPRIGKSKIRPFRDTLNFIQLIIRTILLFNPLRIFLPLASILFLGSIGIFVYSWLWTPKIMDMTTLMLLIGSLQLLATGMLADMINRRLDR